MMPDTRPYAVTLPRLGSFLDAEGVQPVEIADHDRFFAVAWQAAGVRREACLTIAGLPRDAAADGGEWATRLQTLGKLLDGRVIDVSRITLGDDGIVITGSRRGKYLTVRFNGEALASEQFTSISLPAAPAAPAGSPLQRRLGVPPRQTGSQQSL
jgi:hypothetical protein